MAMTALVTEFDNLVGTIEFDAVVREQHTLSAKATEHAIEGNGQARTDHVMQMGDMLVLECIASDTPVHAPKTQARGTQEVTVQGTVVGVGDPRLRPSYAGPLLSLLPHGDSVIDNVFSASATTKGFDPPFERRQDVWRELRRMKEAGEIMTVVTSLEEYTNMVIEEVNTECTVSNGRSLEAVITLKRIAVSESKLVEAPEIPKKATPKGRQNTTPDPEPERSSALFKAADKAGVLPR
jgi:hypothetical protein